ncbi:hypothetical protein UFOVP582_22 [uncultured Caudovirales phage]|uniref:Uncharacterized protein n=1 Tax=uncultured Caudovirales phage TaxID=2100421 RepID=A0A6J7XFC6_9CAUD|nr:hypothetical protein UFOVP582_22 [uncultured Caudovirales phage]CAB4184073.1 hypothetical protein UFOVP1099_32 [uncultured Caudovirales phage]CAB4214445.1 hypothetical protein UFOVP1460_37 [uncultured Caudovirales phage]CAB5228839.1 hypothetical protein UFOVP1548_44 [uncultured Caudovirales phage]
MAKKSAVTVVKGGRFTQVDGLWLVALEMSDKPLSAGTILEFTTKAGKDVQFKVANMDGQDTTIFAVLTGKREFVYNGSRMAAAK